MIGIWADILSSAVRRRRRDALSDRKDVFLAQDEADRTESHDSAKEDHKVKKRGRLEKSPAEIQEIKERTIDLIASSQCNTQNFIIFDALKDSADKVVDKLTKALSVATHESTSMIGFAETESERLSYAWELYILFKHNAKIQGRYARGLHYLSTFIALCTTMFAVVLTASKLDDSETDTSSMYQFSESIDIDNSGQQFLGLATSVLPIVATFVISLVSKFAPQRRSNMLEAAAAHIRCEIYRYRCRINEYGRRAKSEVIERLLNPTLREMRNQGSREDHDVQQQDYVKSRSGGQEAFAEVIQQINNDLMTGDVKMGSLKRPPGDAFKGLAKTLFPAQEIKSAAKAKSRDITDIRDETIASALELKNHSDYEFLHAKAIEEDMQYDDGISVISGEHYILFRLSPMISKLNEDAPVLERWYEIYQTFVFFGTMCAGIVALLGFRAWVPLVIAVVAGVESIAAFEQISAKLMGVNGSLGHLKSLKIWWQSLSKMEKRNAKNKIHLVQATEDAIHLSKAYLGVGSVRLRPVDSEDENEKER